jgi:hypothetical protein
MDPRETVPERFRIDEMVIKPLQFDILKFEPRHKFKAFRARVRWAPDPSAGNGFHGRRPGIRERPARQGAAGNQQRDTAEPSSQVLSPVSELAAPKSLPLSAPSTVPPESPLPSEATATSSAQALCRGVAALNATSAASMMVLEVMGLDMRGSLVVRVGIVTC